MAFDNGIIFDVKSTGDDTNNGGGFSAAATFATDLAATSGTSAAPVVTSASYNFHADDVNHYLFVKAGTNWIPGWYLIASVASNAATLTATIDSVVLYNGASAMNLTEGVATTASPTGGTWGIDYSRSATPRIAYTDMVIGGGGGTTYTSAANPVLPNVVGNVIKVLSGTNFTVQRIQVLSAGAGVASADKAIGTAGATGGTGNLGGALATPGMAAGLVTATGWIATLGNTTYTLSSSSNVSGGRLSRPGCIVFG